MALTATPVNTSNPVLKTDLSWNDDNFSAYVHRVREEIVQLRGKFSFWATVQEAAMVPGGMEIWYGSPLYYHYLKVIGDPGTLVGDIMRMKSDLPYYSRDLEIIGNDVHETEKKPIVFADVVDQDLEDCSEEVSQLPLITFDREKHFTKDPTYKKEIYYLLQCQGSPRVVQLLGRTENGALVFPKYKQDFHVTVGSNTDHGRIQNIKRWMLDIIDAVAYLHSLGIVHRDLNVRNILESNPLVICDLQCHNSTSYCRPFEIDGGDYTKFSFASDVFALGSMLWQCTFFNNPHTHAVMLNNPPPPPFHDIFAACTKAIPEERPTLMQLRSMYEAIGSSIHQG